MTIEWTESQRTTTEATARLPSGFLLWVARSPVEPERWQPHVSLATAPLPSFATREEATRFLAGDLRRRLVEVIAALDGG